MIAVGLAILIIAALALLLAKATAKVGVCWCGMHNWSGWLYDPGTSIRMRTCYNCSEVDIRYP